MVAARGLAAGIAAAAGLLAAVPASAVITTQRVAAGLDKPVFAASPAGDPSRLFVVELGGKIKILDLVTGEIAPTPFLTIPNLATAFGEQGLLGMAFHPDFAHNGQFYVDYVDARGAPRLERYQVLERRRRRRPHADAAALDPAPAAEPLRRLGRLRARRLPLRLDR